MKYKLIKEYPLCCLKLGFIIDTDKSYSGCKATYDWIIQNPTKSKEFWQPIVEKDYEILSLIGNQNFKELRQGEIITKQENGRYKGIDILIWEGEDSLVKMKHWSINSVKRLSDGEIFTIGDKINFNKACSLTYPVATLSEIKLIDNIIYLNNSKNVWSNKLVQCLKLKQPLFTTEDGVDIFEGDNYITITNIFLCSTNKAALSTPPHPQFKHFSTKEKAEEYILMNKPCLSLNDVKRNIDLHHNLKLKTLTELVKSKI